jgi:hypothetical protein
MDAVDLDIVKRHFAVSEISVENGVKDDFKEIEPFVVCSGLSVDTFNKYVEDDRRRLRISLRFLHLDNNGRLLILEYPSLPHEITVRKFELLFYLAFGNAKLLGTRGSFTARRNGFQDKEADATFGPLHNTPNRTPPPPDRIIADWVTFALEVSRTQSWKSLSEAALWWYRYTGIQYILLLKVSERARSMKYWFYDVEETGLPENGVLPDATRVGSFRYDQNGAAETLEFDNRRILSIPPDQALPDDVNDVSVVDLRELMNMVIEHFGVA